MKGLLKNNFYGILSGAKVFLIFMFLLGICVTMMEKNSFMVIVYALLGIIGFSINGITCLINESSSKWNKYKLTAPVKRAEIVRSYFLSQLIWLFAGMLFAGIGITFSILLHGSPFDRNIDIFLIFVMGIGISLFTASLFFPLSYSGGAEKNQVFLIISLIGGIGIFAKLIDLLSVLFHPDSSSPMTTFQLVLSGLTSIICSLSAFALSYWVTVGIFRRTEI